MFTREKVFVGRMRSVMGGHMDILITAQRQHHQLHGEFIEISKNCHINRICCTRILQRIVDRYMKYVFLEFLFPQQARATKVKSNKIFLNEKKKI